MPFGGLSPGDYPFSPAVDSSRFIYQRDTTPTLTPRVSTAKIGRVAVADGCELVPLASRIHSTTPAETPAAPTLSATVVNGANVFFARAAAATPLGVLH